MCIGAEKKQNFPVPEFSGGPLSAALRPVFSTRSRRAGDKPAARPFSPPRALPAVLSKTAAFGAPARQSHSSGLGALWFRGRPGSGEGSPAAGNAQNSLYSCGPRTGDTSPCGRQRRCTGTLSALFKKGPSFVRCPQRGCLRCGPRHGETDPRTFGFDKSGRCAAVCCIFL